MLELADCHFTPHEAAALRKLPANERVLAFYELWTMKEAMLKGIGSGISGGLGSAELSSQPWRSWQERLRLGNDEAVVAVVQQAGCL